MRRKFLVWLLPIVLLAGCIEFERQTMTYSYNPATDTLKIFQDYHGIFGADLTNSLSTEELTQFDTVMNSHRTFFFGNWVAEISHDQLREQLKQIQEAAKDGKLDPHEAHVETLLKLLVDNSKIENGRFYMDSSGKLSGVQRVTLTRGSKLIAAGNVGIRDAYMAEADDSATKPEDREIYLKSAEKQQDYIKLNGNQITVQVPATKRQYDELLSPDNAQKQIEQLKSSGGQFGYTNNQITASLGKAEDKETKLSMNFSAKPYTTNLVEIVKKRGLLVDSFDSERAAKEFTEPRK